MGSNPHTWLYVGASGTTAFFENFSKINGLQTVKSSICIKNLISNTYAALFPRFKEQKLLALISWNKI